MSEGRLTQLSSYRDWLDVSQSQDGFEFCCETAQENGLDYAGLRALVDAAQAFVTLSRIADYSATKREGEVIDRGYAALPILLRDTNG